MHAQSYIKAELTALVYFYSITVKIENGESKICSKQGQGMDSKESF